MSMNTVIISVPTVDDSAVEGTACTDSNVIKSRNLPALKRSNLLQNLLNNVNNMSELPTTTRARSKEKTDMSLNLRSGNFELAARKPISSSTTQINTACTTIKTPVIGVPKISKSTNTKTTTTTTASTITNINENCKIDKALENSAVPKTPPVTPNTPSFYLDDEMESVYSMATTSGRSTMSCEHPYVARNGTTFSGRKMQYMIHCSSYAGQVGADYLTPTQRAQRQVRKLKELLMLARKDLEHKDSEILRLTREVVELRLFKASLSSPEERSASSDAVTVREADLKTSQDVSPIVDMVHEHTKLSPRHVVLQQQQQQHNYEMQSSYADSGHFEDMSTSMHDMPCGSNDTVDQRASDEQNEHNQTLEEYELQRQELIRMYEQRIEELIRHQDTANNEMKRNHNDKIEALLQKLSDCNTRYGILVPDYEHAKERIRELERQLEDLQRKLIEHEEKQKKMYLHMYQQNQESDQLAQADQALEVAFRPSNKVSINELLQQLQSTQDELENIRASQCKKECGNNHALLTAKEAISLWVLGARKTIYRRLLEAQKNHTPVDPDVTLQFLKSAIYYFLTDKENSQGHLRAIESILEFTDAEKQNIARYQK